MVGAENGFVNVGSLEILLEGLTNEKVIDAPTDVIGAGMTPVAPPCVTLFVWMEVAEGIDEAGVEEVGDSLAFLGSKTSVMNVGLWAS